MNRIILKTLLLSGLNKNNAQINFSSGLNVISGPSDTGKTYIFQCLKYCMGSNETPKSIKEAEGYSNVWLSFMIENQDFTVRRDFTTNNIEIYETFIDNITDNSLCQKMNIRNFSDFIMEKLCIQNVRLLKNAKGDTVNLTLAKFRFLSFIDETEVQSESSAFISTQKISQTQDKSFINYLLTGADYSNVIRSDSKEIVQAKIKAKIELLEELIGSDTVTPNEEEIKELIDQIEKIKNEITVVNNKFLNIYTSISDLEKDRKDTDNNIVKAESNIAYKEEMKKRFSLLMDRYEVDIERLDAISQSSELFLSKNNHGNKCPLCGSQQVNMDNKIDKIYLNTVREACKNEILKIENLKTDLYATLNNLNDEINVEQKTTIQLNYHMKEIKDQLTAVVKNEINKIKAELHTLYSKKEELEKKYTRYCKIKELSDLMDKNKNVLENKIVIENYNSGIKASTTYGLCKVIYDTLESWNFPELKEISYSEKDNDIVIGDKNRKDYGKGYRAIIRAALNISLMMYCSMKNISHLGFVVLDSPVLTFRGINTVDKTGKEMISDELKNQFYINLSNVSNDYQIIIIENKEPPEEILNKINYISFTKKTNVGRYGFIPLNDI